MQLTKEKIEKFINEFEKDATTVKWIESVNNRGKYQRDLDKSFYKYVQSTINKLCKLIVLISTTQNSGDLIINNIQKEQEKYITIIEDLETTIKKINNADKS